MRRTTGTLGLAAVLALCSAGTTPAQTGLPSSQPNLLQIYREDVKVGHAADHEKTEAGWPAAFEKAKSPHYYIALASMTGSPEVWFVIPFDSHAALGDSMKLERSNPTLGAELARLQRADAEHLTGFRSIQAIARKELSSGEFPETAKQRFYAVTTFRVRPGRDDDFVAAAKAYGAAMTRARTGGSFRVYQVIAGLPAPTYLIFSSVTSYDGFDKAQMNSEAVGKGINEEERKIFHKFSTEALIGSDTQRFELNPAMSYVPAEVRAADPDFWMPKKPAVKKTTSAAPRQKPQTTGSGSH